MHTWQKLEESTLQQDKRTVFHTSYLTVIHCHPLSVSAAVVLTLVFTIGLAETTPADWSHSERGFFCCLLSLLGRMHNYCLLLLIWFTFMAPEPSSCDLCMHTTQARSIVTKTLLFHTYYSCAGSVIGSCSHKP
jgi:hypothetical protein